LISDNQFENVSIDIEQLKISEEFIPSTPSTALFNTSGELVFIGPYSAGYLCTAGNGFVEELVPRMDSSISHPIVISIAQGCYCNR